MSSDYKTMLYFDSHAGGFVKAEGVRVDLPILPPLEGLPKHITEMYAYPQIRDYRLRVSADRVREMSPPEIEAIAKLFATLAAFGRRILGRET